MSAGDERLTRAKSAAETLTTDKRKWLTAEIKSYDGDSYVSRMHVLEGTPPRAYIIENRQRHICTVLDADGQLFGESRGGDHEPVRWVPRASKKPR